MFLRTGEGSSMKKRNRGFTLLEIMLVLGIMGVILAILMPAMSVRRAANVTATAQTINSLQTAACTWLSQGRTNYTGITVQALRDSALVPAGFDGSNVYGGTFTVGPVATDASMLQITSTSVPDSAGQPIVDILSNNAQSSSYDSDATTVTVTY